MIDHKTMSTITHYLDLILEENKSINLTRISDKNQAMLLHIEDSLAGLPEINIAPPGLYGDIGTGGGFPGVPISLATKRQTLLIDSVGKKIASIERVLDKLNLSQTIKTYTGRAETLADTHKESFSLLTVRAVSRLNSLIELASPLLKMDGHLVCYKARVNEDEIKEAESIETLTGMKMISRRSYYLSDNSSYREIIVYQKVGKPKIKLPRRVGLAQKKPLTSE